MNIIRMDIDAEKREDVCSVGQMFIDKRVGARQIYLLSIRKIEKSVGANGEMCKTLCFVKITEDGSYVLGEEFDIIVGSTQKVDMSRVRAKFLMLGAEIVKVSTEILVKED